MRRSVATSVEPVTTSVDVAMPRRLAVQEVAVASTYSKLVAERCDGSQ
jgi:hypothetical protein